MNARQLSVTKSVVVDIPQAEAFSLFVDQGRWWPVETHHLAKQPGDTVVLEPFVGGRWFEIAADGTECDWGVVLEWKPPERVVLTWQVAPGWVYEADPSEASEIAVRFLPVGPVRTRVELEHRRLERYGKSAERMRSILDAPDGAVTVLVAFADTARTATPLYSAAMEPVVAPDQQGVK
jgi:uncharacterized protein YndB with AHSA1/START domain